MTRSSLSTGFVLILLGCGDVSEPSVSDDIGSTRQPLTGTRIGPVSEESSKSSAICPAGTAALAAERSGSYCDDMYLWCGTQPTGGFVLTGEDKGWTSYISEENSGALGVQCPPSSVVDGIRATGKYSDNVSVHCTGAITPRRGLVVSFSAWFSEEQGYQRFPSNISFPGTIFGAFATSVKCRGNYCDDLSFGVEETFCRNDADCGGGNLYCNPEGWCRIG